MPRLVKRYSNRKLYDTSESRYVTLDEIARWVKARRGGEDPRERDRRGPHRRHVRADHPRGGARRRTACSRCRVLRDIIQHGEAALQGIAASVDRGMEAIRSAPSARGRACRSSSRWRPTRLGDACRQRLDEVVRRSVERVDDASRPSARDAAHRAHSRACSRRASRGSAPAAEDDAAIPVSRRNGSATRRLVGPRRRPCDASRSARQEDRRRRCCAARTRSCCRGPSR